MNYSPIELQQKSSFELIIERIKLCYKVLTVQQVVVIVKEKNCFDLEAINFTKADQNLLAETMFNNVQIDNYVTEKCKGRVSEILGYDI